MSENPKTTVVIEIDLDEGSLDEQFVKITKKSKETSKKIGEDLENDVGGSVKNTTEIIRTGLNKQLTAANKSTESLSKKMLDVTAAGIKLSSVAGFSAIIVSNFKDLADTSAKLGKTVFSTNGLFKLTGALGATGLAFGLLTKAIGETESKILQSFRSISAIGAVVFGGLSAGIGFLILKFADLAQVAGAKMVGFFIESAKAFNKSEKGLLVYNQVIGNYSKLTEGASGSTKSWTKTVNELSDSLNFTREETRKATQEIVSVGAQLGLSQKQLEKLTTVTAEYAKVNGKDLFETSVKMVSALNGQAQGVQSLGIKLGAASVQQFAYKKGITRTIASMTEAEKVQLRYSKLLKQYKNIAGAAALAAGSLADQQIKLDNNLKRLKTSLGEGARIIEQNNLVAGAMNIILNNLSGSAAKAAGFLGALGGRVLQVGGFFLEWSFKIFAVVKAFKLLDIILKSQTGMSAFAKNIPFLNKSMNQLIGTLTGSSTKIAGTTSLMKSLFSILKNGMNSFLLTISGQGLKGASIMKVLGGSILKLGGILSVAASSLTAFLLPLAPFIVIGSLIAGVVVVLYNVFETLEEKTGFFSETWSILMATINSGMSVLEPVLVFFSKMKKVVIDLAQKAFGRLTSGFAKVAGAFAAFAASNPFGIFGKKAVARFDALAIKMKRFDEDLKKAGFDVRKLSGEFSRKPAGKSFIDVNLEQLTKLRKELRDFSTSEFQRIKEQEAARLNLLEAAQAKGLLAAGEFELLKGQSILNSKEQVNEALLSQLGMFQQTELEKINEQEVKRKQIALEALSSTAINKQAHEQLMTDIEADAISQRQALAEKEKKNRLKTMGNLGQGLVNIMSQTMQMLGRGLVEGGTSFNKFLGLVLNVFGDMAIAIGVAALGSIAAIQGLKASIAGTGAVGIAKALGLIAIGGAMKAAGSAMGGGAGGGVAGTVNAGGGIGSGSGGTGSIESGQFVAQNDERAKQQNVINLTVEGNVVDSEEEGTRIARVLQKSFNKEGVVLNNPRTA